MRQESGRLHFWGTHQFEIKRNFRAVQLSWEQRPLTVEDSDRFSGSVRRRKPEFLFFQRGDWLGDELEEKSK